MQSNSRRELQGGRIVVGAVVAVALLYGLAAELFARHEAPSPAEAPLVFTPTPGQWETLKLVEVRRTNTPGSAPAAPEDAVLYEGGAARVWVVQPNGNSLASREVRTGRVRGGLVEILSGLTPGERVVSGGSLFIDNAAKGG